MSKKSVLTIVTDQILSVLESGVIPWQKPWVGCGGAHRNFVRKSRYTGINTFILAVSAWERKFSTPWWLTVNDAKKLGGRIKKESWSSPTCVVFYRERWFHSELNLWAKADEVKAAPVMREHGYEQRLILRYYKVYNLDQCEGIEPPQVEEPIGEGFSPIEKAETILCEMPDPPAFQYEGYRAFYSPKRDLISVPTKESFRSEDSFYATFFHELIHSTGHEKRLNREAIASVSHYASDSYSKEELTAEMGSAMLCLEAGITPDWQNSASYVDSWLKALQADRQWLLYGAAKAQAAVDFILVH